MSGDEAGHDRDCEAVRLALIDGVRPSEDAALARHVGCCLQCFRVASDMRELPAIAARVRDAAPPDADPGEAFWATLSTRVGSAWEASRAPRPSVGARLLAWLRQPAPAALCGAAASALLLLAALRDPRPRSHAPTAAAPARPVAVAPAPAAPEARATVDDGIDAMDLTDDAVWDGLDLTLLSRVAARQGPSVAPRTDATDLDASFSASPFEELEALGTEDLRKLSRALEARKGI